MKIILLTKSVTNLEPHPFSPVIVILRRVQNPPIFSTNIERVGLRAREYTKEKQQETSTYLKFHEEKKVKDCCVLRVEL